MPRPQGYRINTECAEDRMVELGLNRSTVAERAEMSLGSYMDILKGRRGASPALAQALASTLRCQPATLFPELSRAASHRFSWTELEITAAVPA